jgi:hypothetical protein
MMENLLAATSVIAGDYEVLGLASDGRHYFWIFFVGLHGYEFPVGAFVGAACRSFSIR